jgi:hypothetical protein
MLNGGRRLGGKPMKFGGRGGGGGGGGRRIFKAPRGHPVVKSQLWDIAQGFVQDQVEWHFDTRLQTGQPTGGSVLGDAMSKLFRQLMGWVPEETHTSKEAELFLEAKGLPKQQAKAALDGDYHLFSPETFLIFQAELGLSTKDVVEIKDELRILLAADNEASRRRTLLTE